MDENKKLDSATLLKGMYRVPARELELTDDGHVEYGICLYSAKHRSRPTTGNQVIALKKIDQAILKQRFENQRDGDPAFMNIIEIWLTGMASLSFVDCIWDNGRSERYAVKLRAKDDEFVLDKITLCEEEIEDALDKFTHKRYE